MKKKQGGLFFKLLISAVVLHGIACVSMSYVLAWLDRVQVVESVSQTIVTEIIAPVIVYGLTKTVENIFSKNKLSFSEPIRDDELLPVTDEVEIEDNNREENE